MKWFSKCPLLLSLMLSAIVLTVIGRSSADGAYQEYQNALQQKPALTAVFLGVKDGVFFWEEPVQQVFAPEEDDAGVSETDGIDLNSVKDRPTAEEVSVTDNMPDSEHSSEVKSETAYDLEGNIWETNPADSSVSANSVSQNEMEADIVYEFERVEEDYFDDALFIGDSRTQGMFEYGGLEERAAFYCKTSLTVHDLFEKQKDFIRIGEDKLTLEEALGQRQFGKVYLMLGINELGTGTPETFLASYAAAVEKIRQLQPDAVIFVQSIMRVAGEKNANDPLFNNTNINKRNELLQTLADDRNVFYIDVNEAVCDENGNLHSEWTFDQIHLKAKYYEVWKEILLEHGIVHESFMKNFSK